MFCGACSQQMNPDARFCSHCGRPVPPQGANFHFNNFRSGRITRPRYGRMIGGVCAGFAEHYGWDPVLVRLAAVVLFVPCHVFIVIAYIAAWIVMPNAPLFYVTPPPPPNYGGSAPGSPAGSAPVS